MNEKDIKIAYFSAEIGISESLPTYSGGLGVLAGDHIKAAVDLGLPIVGISLLYQIVIYHNNQSILDIHKLNF